MCVIDNLDEIDRLGRHARESQPVMLRVVPEVETDTHHAVATGHADQKFGLTLDEAREAIGRLGAAAWADLQGIHMHIGSQLFDLDPYREAIAAIAALGASSTTTSAAGSPSPTPPSTARPRSTSGSRASRARRTTCSTHARRRSWSSPGARSSPTPA